MGIFYWMEITDPKIVRSATTDLCNAPPIMFAQLRRLKRNYFALFFFVSRLGRFFLLRLYYILFTNYGENGEFYFMLKSGPRATTANRNLAQYALPI